MSEMVERVARAMCIEDGHDPEGDDCWNFGRDHSIKKKNWEAYVTGARAAIEAMREPGFEMVEAGQKVNNLDDTPGHYEFLSRDEITEAWQAMIDEALKS